MKEDKTAYHHQRKIMESVSRIEYEDLVQMKADDLYKYMLHMSSISTHLYEMSLILNKHPDILNSLDPKDQKTLEFIIPSINFLT